MTTNQLGKITEVNVMKYLIEKGFSVSIPFCDKDRYDQIWDINNHLLRVQIKTSRWIDDKHSGITFNCYSINNGKRHKYTKDEIDVFATMFDGELYVVPISECSNEKKLRFFSNQPSQPNISWAKDYTFEAFLKKIT